MLTGLSFGSAADLEQEHKQQEERERSRRREERKQQKKERAKAKHKKEKHKKEKRRAKHGSSSDSEPSSGPEDAWQQQQEHSSGPGSPVQQQQQQALQREDWMTVPMARSSGLPLAAPPKQQEAAKPDPDDAPVVAGIRYMKPEQAAAAAAREEARKKAAEDAAAAAATAAAAGRGRGGPGPISAEAGVTWRVKALARAQQLAKEQGRGLNEVLSERWGSAAEIAKGLMDNAAAQQQQRGTGDGGDGSHRQQQQQQRGRDGAVPHYLSDVRSERGGMMRPPSSAAGRSSGGSKLSWRRPQPAGDAAAGAGGSGSGSGSRPDDRGNDNRRDEARDSQRDRDRERPPDRERDSERPRHVGDSDRERAGDGGDRRRGHGSGRGDEARTREGERARAPERSSRDHGDRHRDGDGDRRSDRGREGDRDRGARGSDRSRGGSDWRQQRQQQEQAQQQQEVVEALKAVAGSINTFSNDGSFMQQFQRLAQADGDKQQQQQQPDGSPGSSMDEGDAQLQDGAGPPSAPKLVAADGAAAAAGAGVGSNRSKADLLRERLGGRQAAPAGAAACNRSAADALRARLGGKAPDAAAAAAGGDDEGRGSRQAEVVHLPLVDASGRAAPGAFGRESAAQAQRALEAAAGGRVAKRVQRYGADGTRERYFADDDSADLQTLVKRAKHGDDSMADIDATMAANISRRARLKATDLDPDDEYDHDAGLDLTESRRRRGDVQQQQQRERQRQVAAFNRVQRLEDKCGLCFKSPQRNQDLALAVGQAAYLSLMPRGRLVEGHCCIVTQEHTPSMRQVDDDTWAEVRNFQACLARMFGAQGREVVFLETAVGLGSHRHHALMEAVPLEPAAFGRAPLYFKKALQEAESEWSQHASKAVIDTRAKGLRGSVPPNFPYVYVQFGLAGGGFVHVIDDEARFDASLGRQVLAGLLQLPADMAHRRPAALEAGTARREAAAFRKQFSPYF